MMGIMVLKNVERTVIYSDMTLDTKF